MYTLNNPYKRNAFVILVLFGIQREKIEDNHRQ